MHVGVKEGYLSSLKSAYLFSVGLSSI